MPRRRSARGNGKAHKRKDSNFATGVPAGGPGTRPALNKPPSAAEQRSGDVRATTPILVAARRKVSRFFGFTSEGVPITPQSTPGTLGAIAEDDQDAATTSVTSGTVRRGLTKKNGPDTPVRTNEPAQHGLARSVQLCVDLTFTPLPRCALRSSQPTQLQVPPPQPGRGQRQRSQLPSQQQS